MSEGSAGGGQGSVDEGQILTARGTEDGLVFRIDGRADWSEITSELEDLLGGRKKFFDGGQVYLEWLERLPTSEQREELEKVMSQRYGMNVSTRKKKTFKRLTGGKTSEPTPLFDDLDTSSSLAEQIELRGLEGDPDSHRGLLSSIEDAIETVAPKQEVKEFFDMGFGSEVDPSGGPVTNRATNEELRKKYISRVTELLEEEMMLEGDANAKVVFGTVRSGQRIETPFSLVVLGDVNPGADLTAGGDIIVLGALRGTAHASAYDEDTLDKVILALQMRPVQLRIGSVISRGSDDKVSGVELARIDDRRIVVESYNPRSMSLKRNRI